MHIVFAVAAALYLAWVLPFAYFRPEDWFLLGASLVGDGGGITNIFSPTLVAQGIEQIWFFRPVFKLILNLFYFLFGTSFWLWFSAMLVGLFTGIWLGCRIVKVLTRSRRLPVFFAIIMCASIHLHIGNAIWLVEGVGTSFQLLFLALNLFFLCQSIYYESPKQSFYSALALVFYVLALGVKESSLFQVGFLYAILFLEPRSEEVDAGLRRQILRRYVVISLVYAAICFIFASEHITYHVDFTWRNFVTVAGYFLLGLGLSAGSVLLVCRFVDGESFHDVIRGLKQRAVGVLFVFGTTLPFLGYSFFSKGWLLLPGFYLVMLVVLSARKVHFIFVRKTFTLVGAICFLSGVVAVSYRLIEINWISWKPAQAKLHHMVRSIPDQTVKEINIIGCHNLKFPKMGAQRVLGRASGIEYMYALEHSDTIKVNHLSCKTTPSRAQIRDPEKIYLRWIFPTLEWLSTPREGIQFNQLAYLANHR